MLTRCDQCRTMHSERIPPTTPICELGNPCRVELVRDNEDAAKIFMTVRAQCECRWDGEKDVEIDLHHPSVWKAIEKFPNGVKDEWECFEKIRRAWHTLRQRRDEGD